MHFCTYLKLGIEIKLGLTEVLKHSDLQGQLRPLVAEPEQKCKYLPDL